MQAAPTRIILLGRIAIERDGDVGPRAGLAGRRSEIVFAYLAVEHRRSVSRDELANVLWPELLPDTWNAALRGVLSDVRRFLDRAGLNPAETLLTEQGRLRLQLPDGVRLDIDEAHTALAEARDLLARGDAAAAATKAGHAADAAALPFLSFHSEAWVSEVRADLDRLHTDALEVLARALADAGDPRGALAAADRLVRADPFFEAAHRLRIGLLGDAGDRAGALRAFERCRSLLEAELGIAPSPETEEALRLALQGAAVSDEVASPEPAPPRGGPTGSRFGGYSVLVVEDHDFQRRTTLMLLRGLGVRHLHDASDGTAALAVLDGIPAPDVIVCDIDMPAMDGVEFIRHVAERRLASAVVIASGLDGRVLETVRAASEGYGLQVLGAVGKPLTAAALESLLASYRPRPQTRGASSTSEAGNALLATALAAGSLPVDFEPIVDLSVGRVAGFRAVPRWTGPEPPVDAADAAGLGRPLAEHVLTRTRDVMGRLELDAYVELSPRVLTDVSLADALAVIARDRVVLVVGAAALAAENDPAMLEVLARLRVKGYGLCIEGFDPGVLERLPLTHLELPADLVAAGATTGDPSPLHAPADASRVLGIPMIGRCSTEAEFDVLLQVGCSFAHGPFLGAAVTAAQLPEVARDWTAPTAAADAAR